MEGGHGDLDSGQVRAEETGQLEAGIARRMSCSRGASAYPSAQPEHENDWCDHDDKGPRCQQWMRRDPVLEVARFEAVEERLRVLGLWAVLNPALGDPHDLRLGQPPDYTR